MNKTLKTSLFFCSWKALQPMPVIPSSSTALRILLSGTFVCIHEPVSTTDSIDNQTVCLRIIFCDFWFT